MLVPDATPEEPFDPDTDRAEITQAMDSSEAGCRVIGRYRLVQKIGEGGMGEVWLAEQKEPVRRRVALKLVKQGINSREIIARFESERQTLALMDHPNIAKVFDAGTTPQGSPYFVMEYVAGVPITEYCDTHRLSTRERLMLFVRVCEGVQHAHQKAIIHRDLKPSNILVIEVDGRPAPKIIDFGVAKALTQKLTAETMFTRVGVLVGTPEYMSPEQARSSGEDIDTRTDIYALGIIFYELLAGAPPIELRNVVLEELLHRLREEEPPKPSTRIRMQDAATSTDVSRKRQTDPRSLVRLIRGDLDSIALKAVEKDRSRRYSSAEQFAEDILRHLEGRPVIARPPTLVYRSAKYIRRHRWGVAAVSAVGLSLVGGVIAEQREARLAAERFELVRGLAHKLIFDIHNEVAKLPGSTKPREVLVSAALDYLDKLSNTAGDDPSLLADMSQGYVQVARAQGFPAEPNLGRTKDAMASMQKAILLCERAARLDKGRRSTLADIYLRMATLSSLTGAAGADEYTRKGLDLAEALNRESPGDKRVLTLLAVSNATLGDRLEYDNSAAALAAYDKCRAYQTELIKLEPTTENRIRLVRANVRVGSAASKLSELGVAAEALGHAESQMLQLLSEEPKNPAFQRQMALTYQSLSFLNENPEFPNLGNSRNAIDYARKYVADQQAQADTNPDDANGGFSLSMALLCQSRALRKADPREALGSAGRALNLIEKSLSRSPGNTLVISRRARVLMQLGRAHLAVGDRQAARETAAMALQQQRQVTASSKDSDEQRLLLWALIGAAEALDAAGEGEAASRNLLEAGHLAETLLQRTPVQLPLAIPSSNVFSLIAARAFKEHDVTTSRQWLERNARLWRSITSETAWVQARRLEAERLLQDSAVPRTPLP
jgi:serine/threonine protein kinase